MNIQGFVGRPGMKTWRVFDDNKVTMRANGDMREPKKGKGKGKGGKNAEPKNKSKEDEKTEPTPQKSEPTAAMLAQSAVAAQEKSQSEFVKGFTKVDGVDVPQYNDDPEMWTEEKVRVMGGARVYWTTTYVAETSHCYIILTRRFAPLLSLLGSLLLASLVAAVRIPQRGRPLRIQDPRGRPHGALAPNPPRPLPSHPRGGCQMEPRKVHAHPTPGHEHGRFLRHRLQEVETHRERQEEAAAFA